MAEAKSPRKRPKTGRLNRAPDLKILGQWEGLAGPAGSSFVKGIVDRPPVQKPHICQKKANMGHGYAGHQPVGSSQKAVKNNGNRGLRGERGQMENEFRKQNWPRIYADEHGLVLP